MEASTGPALRYLTAEDVTAAMPPVAERLDLAERTLAAIDATADMPPKIGVHPRPPSSFAHAMPAFLRGSGAAGSQEDDPTADRLGMKWVSGFPANRELGLPAISAIVVLNDVRTGLPIAILDGGPITAERTAAVSGVAISRFGPSAGSPGVAGGPLRVAFLGAGTQGHSHVPVIGHLLPGCSLVVHDRHLDRAEAVAAAAAATATFGSTAVAEQALDAVVGADVVLTMLSFGPDRQLLPAEALATASLVVAVDYDMAVPAAIARGVVAFYVDEADSFRATRDGSVFRDYPDPSATIGQAIRAATPRPEGRILVTHLGVGLADVVFGSAILDRAARSGIGTLLPR